MSTSRKIDSLFDWADRMYKAGRFAEVDFALARVPVERLAGGLIYSWLCVAWWPEQVPSDKGKIPSRAILHRRVAAHWEVHNPILLKQVREHSMEGFFTA